jgi:hypothetical protein
MSRPKGSKNKAKGTTVAVNNLKHTILPSRLVFDDGSKSEWSSSLGVPLPNATINVELKDAQDACKKLRELTPPIDRLEELLDWGPKIEAFCEKKGFPPSELIEKFEQLERDKLFAATQLGEFIANSSHVTFKKDMTPHEILEEFGVEAYRKALEAQNKPHTAPQIEKRVQDEPESKNGHQKAEISPETGLAIEGMPEGLTAIQQAVWKNNQKMKTKPAPIAGFGLTKKEKS